MNNILKKSSASKKTSRLLTVTSNANQLLNKHDAILESTNVNTLIDVDSFKARIKEEVTSQVLASSQSIIEKHVDSIRSEFQDKFDAEKMAFDNTVVMLNTTADKCVKKIAEYKEHMESFAVELTLESVGKLAGLDHVVVASVFDSLNGLSKSRDNGEIVVNLSQIDYSLLEKRGLLQSLQFEIIVDDSLTHGDCFVDLGCSKKDYSFLTKFELVKEGLLKVLLNNADES